MHADSADVVAADLTFAGVQARAYLDACGLAPRMVRSTRLVDLVNTMDPKLVATAFGMTEEATMIYLTDYVDADRLITFPQL